MMGIGVVLVTFNRLDKLKIALDSYAKQTVLPDYIVVIDNASTDETPNFLKHWLNRDEKFDKKVIPTSSNLGGSGGFNKALEYAANLNSEWIWAADDDAFPEENALELAKKFIEGIRNTDDVSAICSSVLNFGEFDLGHRRNIVKSGLNIKDNVLSNVRDYGEESFEIQCFSFVGAIINKEKIKSVGLPLSEYFIWYDDTEYSLRLHKEGRIICVPSIRVHHDVGDQTQEFSWKMYYGIRNCADMIKRHYGKSYFDFFCLKWWLKSFNHTKKERDLILTALSDARKGRFGMSHVYRPGVKIN